jgi:hypothetical protein
MPIPRIDTAEVHASPLVRTAFGDDAAFERLLTDAQAPYEYGFRASFEPVISDRAFDGATVEELAAAEGNAYVVYVADETSMTSEERSIIVVDRSDEPGRSFRCVLSELWGPENNLRVANMDFDDFFDNLDDDGVFRGFPR